MNKRFKKISNKSRSELEESLQLAVIEQFRQEEVEKGFYKYEVQLREIKFVTGMSDEELKQSAKLTIDLLEEMKEINNSGMDRETFCGKVAEIQEREKDELMQQLHMWEILGSKKMKEIICELDCVRRVGGAYAMLISNPCLKSTIFGVYDVIVDKFDDEELYRQCCYFMMRAVMRMHSNEI